MRLCDVLIVGAGPAGSAAALVLARAGVRVRLVDRARFPRPKLCGDTLNPGALAVILRLGLLDEVRGASVPLDGMTVSGPGGAAVTGVYGPGMTGAAVSRTDFDAILLRQAVDAGTEFEEGITVAGALLGRGGRWPAIVEGAHGAAGGRPIELRARLTIAADGRRSAIAFGLGLARHPARPRRFAIGTSFEGVAGLGRLGEMHVRPGHYIGVAPLPHDLANVCLVVPEAAARRAGGRWADLLGGVIAGDEGLRHRFAAARRVAPPMVLGPLAVDAVRRRVPGLLVAGDAAGFIDPMTGDGMRFALRGGELAAAEALRLLDEGPGDVPRLGRLLEGEFGRKRAFNRALRRLVGSPAAVRAAAAGAGLLPPLVAWMVRYAGDVRLAGHQAPRLARVDDH